MCRLSVAGWRFVLCSINGVGLLVLIVLIFLFVVCVLTVILIGARYSGAFALRLLG